MLLCIRRAALTISFVVAVSTTALFAQQHCGKERWSVKTGTDGDVSSVNLSTPQTSTIAQLIALTPPSPIPPANRVDPTENTVFVVNATLTDYKLEGSSTGDSDYHLVLQDDQGNTMVAEIPSPDCVGSESPFAGQIANARAEFDSQFTATTSFQTANVPVQVTGVGFFDFAHGQHGAAPNVIELHPVLDILFNPSSNVSALTLSSDFTLSLSVPAIHILQGGSTSTVVSTSTSGSAINKPTVSVSGLPIGITSHVTPTGSGKAVITFSASAAAPTGSFPLTITGTSGARSHSQTVSLNVSPYSPTPGTQQWEYKLITANSEQDVMDQANALGAQEWEMVGVVKVPGSTNTWRAFFKRLKNNF